MARAHRPTLRPRLPATLLVLAGAVLGVLLLLALGTRSTVSAPSHVSTLPLLAHRLAGLQGKDFGINMAGAEFGQQSIRCGIEPGGSVVVVDAGIDDTELRPPYQESHYLYPALVDDYRYWRERGMNVVRIPVRWERLQRRWFTPLHEPDLANLRRAMDAAHAGGMRVILDLHNFGRYCEIPLTAQDGPALADVWARLAEALHTHPAMYAYELMNEPHDLPGHDVTWNLLAQAATNAVRQHDQIAWIYVPGYGWSSAPTWPQNNAALAVTDPRGRMLYVAHLYFDADHSGRYRYSYDQEGAYPAIGVDRLQPFQAWLAARGARGIVTEYGVPRDDPRWLVVLRNALAVIDADPRLQGGTYWAAGPWWPVTDQLAVTPLPNGDPKPQEAVIREFPWR